MTNSQGAIDTTALAPVLVRRTGDWHPAYIKFRLGLAGTSFAEISRRRRRQDGRPYSRTWAQIALYRPHPLGEAAIAEAIGVTAMTIWPSRYNLDGTPRHGRAPEPQRKSISAHSRRNGDHRGRD